MTTIKHIKVSDESLRKGYQGENDTCPLALELNKAFGPHHKTSVFDESAEVRHFNSDGTITRYFAKLPIEARCFVEAFDEEGAGSILQEWMEFDIVFDQCDVIPAKKPADARKGTRYEKHDRTKQ